MNDKLLDELASEQSQETVHEETLNENQTQIESEASLEAPKESPPQDESGSAPPPGLIEERNRRKEAQEQAKQATQKITELETQINQFKQYDQQTQEQLKYYQGLEDQLKEIRERVAPKEEEQIPDFNENPAEHLLAQTRALQKELSELKTTNKEMTETQKQETQMREVLSEISTQETLFAKQNPDYQKAYDYVKGIKEKELRTYGLTDAQIQHELNRAAFQTGYAALQQGKNPGEVIYNMAKVYGYQNAEQSTEKPGQDSEQMKKDQETLETLEKGLEASKTLDSSGKPSAEQLLSISDDDLFNQAAKEAFGTNIESPWAKKTF